MSRTPSRSEPRPHPNPRDRGGRDESRWSHDRGWQRYTGRGSGRGDDNRSGATGAWDVDSRETYGALDDRFGAHHIQQGGGYGHPNWRDRDFARDRHASWDEARFADHRPSFGQDDVRHFGSQHRFSQAAPTRAHHRSRDEDFGDGGRFAGGGYGGGYGAYGPGLPHDPEWGRARTPERGRRDAGWAPGSSPGMDLDDAAAAARRLSPKRRTPKGYTRPDSRIQDDLCDRLYHRDDLDVSEVSIDVRDGTVYLEGSTPDRRMKHDIEDLAEQCIGVHDVDNRIRVVRGRDLPDTQGTTSEPGLARGTGPAAPSGEMGRQATGERGGGPSGRASPRSSNGH